LNGSKTVEVRVGYKNITCLESGDLLVLNNEHPFTINRIGRYANFEELIAVEDPRNITPHLTPDEELTALRTIYPPEKEILGAIALQLEPTQL
jgi:ASC-1-like (ASCH) protein